MTDCARCVKEHEAHAAEEELLDMPIRSIRDGYLLRNGDLYLMVACDDGVTRTLQIPRYNISGKRIITLHGAWWL
jgi:hypothetical protein